jgi:ornithine--oxo-acid transaminase
MSQPNLGPVPGPIPSQLPSQRTPVFPEPTFLMCSPKLYDVHYVINPWMAGNVSRTSRQQAAAQWESLHDALQQVARVMLVEPQPGWPDMVFTANAGLVRKGIVAISRFYHPERQGEESHFRRWFDDLGFGVSEMPFATPFEGEGDALFEPDSGRLWAGHGVRTNQSSHSHLQSLWGVEVVSLRLVDPRFYHLDTCFCPLTGGDLLYFPAAFDAESNAKIEAHYPPARRIAVREPDALRFACNAINVGRVVLLNQISPELSRQLEARGFHVVQLQLTEFLKAGGAAKCLALRLSEMEATHSTTRPGAAA